MVKTVSQMWGSHKRISGSFSTFAVLMWYLFLDIFFFVFHTVITIFNVTGWLFRRTRKWNLITLLLTAFSWFILGIWYGWGYCFCTDWHWEVREHLGYHDQRRSYVHFLLLKLTGVDFNEALVEDVTLYAFLFSLFMSALLNYRDHKRKQQAVIHKNTAW